MSRLVYRTIAVVLWVAFLWIGYVAIVLHFIPHFLGTDQEIVGYERVWFLVFDVLILQAIAWAYKKLPDKPAHWIFRWLEKVSLF